MHCSPFVFDFFYRRASFFISCFVSFCLVRRLLYLGSSIAETLHLHNGAGTAFFVVVHVLPSRPCLLYDVAFTSLFSHLSLVSRCSAVAFPSYMYFYHLFHLPALAISVVLSLPVSSMCIPYSISRCSLTLYGAHASHHLYDFAATRSYIFRFIIREK